MCFMNQARFVLLFATHFFIFQVVSAQTGEELMMRVKAKLNLVKNYQADGMLKTNVSFMKLPDSRVTVYYKSPNQFRVKKDDGISVIPKGGVSINLNSLVSHDGYTVVDAGQGNLNGSPVRILKLIPTAENSEVILSTLFIDEKEALIKKATTTTRDNGTYEMQMNYGAYANYGLPDKVIFSFNTKDYKLPKGVTFEYDTGEKPAANKEVKSTKGSVEIAYSKYLINTSIPDSVF